MPTRSDAPDAYQYAQALIERVKRYTHEDIDALMEDCAHALAAMQAENAALRHDIEQVATGRGRVVTRERKVSFPL